MSRRSRNTCRAPGNSRVVAGRDAQGAAFGAPVSAVRRRCRCGRRTRCRCRTAGLGRPAGRAAGSPSGSACSGRRRGPVISRAVFLVVCRASRVSIMPATSRGCQQSAITVFSPRLSGDLALAQDRAAWCGRSRRPGTPARSRCGCRATVSRRSRRRAAARPGPGGSPPGSRPGVAPVRPARRAAAMTGTGAAPRTTSAAYPQVAVSRASPSSRPGPAGTCARWAPAYRPVNGSTGHRCGAGPPAAVPCRPLPDRGHRVVTHHQRRARRQHQNHQQRCRSPATDADRAPAAAASSSDDATDNGSAATAAAAVGPRRVRPPTTPGRRGGQQQG